MIKFWTRHLDTLDILSAAVYGIMIVMMFTISVHIFSHGLGAMTTRAEVNSLFKAAVSSALTWAFIDAVIFLLGSVAERDQSGRIVRSVQRAPSRQHAIAEVSTLLGDRLYDVTNEEERGILASSIVNQLNNRKAHHGAITRDDVVAAFAMFTAGAAGTLPISLPLLLIPDPWLALRMSNAVAIISLFIMGYYWAKHAGVRPVRTGLVIAMVGTLLVMVAIWFGG
jgi:hypothetical protein